MKIKSGFITAGSASTVRFIVGAKPPELSEDAKRKLKRRKPSKKAAKLVACISKAKVTISY